MLGEIGVFLCGVLLIVVGARYLFRAFQFWRITRRFKSWPTVMGKITQSRIRYEAPFDDPNYSHSYSPDVWYQYEVDGVPYTRTEYPLDRSLDTEANVRKIVERYRLWQHVRVYYNPRNPGYSMLDPADDTHLWRTFWIGLGSLLTGIVLVALIAALTL